MASRRTKGLLGAGCAASALSLIAAPVWLTTQPVLARPAAGPPMYPSQLEAEVRELSRAPRGHDDAARLDEVSAHLAGVFASAGADVSTQEFTPAHAPAPVRNVIARVGPASEERVVVGARYDAAPGELDANGATGVAALVALAGSLGTARLGVGVELVAFALGAPPYLGTVDMGSAHHARAVRARRGRVRAMLAIEGMGALSRADGSTRLPRPLGLLYPTRAEFVAVVGRYTDWRLVRAVKRAMAGATDLPVRSISGTRRLARVDAGDQQSYWAAGFPAVMITDTSHMGWRARPADADAVDYRAAAKATSALSAAIVELAR